MTELMKLINVSNEKEWDNEHLKSKLAATKEELAAAVKTYLASFPGK
ncbi:hypothetical protein [Planococcus sp. ISL-109]|nr:hypothetical protein [Planococcus sp. ISL-109]MBT2582945.1 hypothetical protein [Planococcus sp. ISL-109]